MSRKKTPILVIVVLLSMMLLSACSSAATSTPPAVATTGAAASATTAPAATTAASTAATTAPAAATTAAGAATTAASGAATTAPASGAAGAFPPACDKPNTPATGGEIKIGVMGPFTGPSASFGVAIRTGVKIALDEINNCGGVNGKKITTVERDDQAKPDVGQTNVRELIDNKDIVALLGTANTAVGTPQAPIVNQSKIAWVIPVTTGTKITQDTTSTPNYVFRVSMVDSEQVPFMVEYALSKYKKIAFINDDTTYGQSGKADADKVFDAKGIKPILNEVYKVGWTADDMKPMVNKIKTAAPDVIISWGLGAENANIKKAMTDLGVTTPLFGSWGLAQPEFRSNGGAAVEGTVIPQTISVDTTNPRQLAFFDTYRKLLNVENVGFPAGLSQAYDAMWMLALAMRQAGPDLTRDKIRDALENFGSYDGLIKKYEKPFSNQYHEAFTRKDFFLTSWKDGKLLKFNG